MYAPRSSMLSEYGPDTATSRAAINQFAPEYNNLRRMRKNILGRPTSEIEPGTIRQEAETRSRQIGTVLTRQHDVELFLQGVQMQDVGCRIRHLRVAKFFGAPVG